MHKNGLPGREIHLIPLTLPEEFFRPNLSDDELKTMFDEHGDIRFSKIFEWMIPTFAGVSFCDFLSTRMRNFMLRSIKDNGWTPKNYCPANTLHASLDANWHGV